MVISSLLLEIFWSMVSIEADFCKRGDTPSTKRRILSCISSSMKPCLCCSCFTLLISDLSVVTVALLSIGKWLHGYTWENVGKIVLLHGLIWNASRYIAKENVIEGHCVKASKPLSGLFHLSNYELWGQARYASQSPKNPSHSNKIYPKHPFNPLLCKPLKLYSHYIPTLPDSHIMSNR